MSRTEAIFCSYLPAPRFCPNRLSGFERYGDVTPTMPTPWAGCGKSPIQAALAPGIIASQGLAG